MTGCVAALCGVSLISHGLFDAFVSACLVLSTEAPLKPELLMDTGVNVLAAGVDAGLLPSPSRTSASTALSTFPSVLFRTSEFLLLSSNPMSRNVASFESKLLPTPVIFMPKIWLGLLLRGLSLSPVADLSLPLRVGERGGVKWSGLDREKVELALRRLKPNLFPGLGGKAGGSSLQDPVPVLPVFCLAAGAAGVPCDNVRDSYFCRINFSIADSTMSASTGISARTPFGFQTALLLTLPICFMLSTCSADHVSILKLLTLLTCVPSLRCSAAQRIHRNMPKFHDAQPGFFALQSAHRSLPGTVLINSCNCRSLRACWRFETAVAMFEMLWIGKDVYRCRTWRKSLIHGRKHATR